MKLEAATVFIRASGERTEGECLRAIEAQGLSSDQIEYIRETPFSKALSVGYSRAIEKGAEWSYFIDADIILRPKSMETLQSFAARQGKDVFCFQGYFLDKFTVSLRDGGVHAYRTSFLDRALALSTQEKENIRPESAVKLALMRQGLRWEKFNYVVGIHDFEQYNFDIFRKGFVHAQKHFHLLSELLPKLKRRATLDSDYSVLIDGIAEGLRTKDDARIDVHYPPFAARFAALGIGEKTAMHPGELSSESVEEILNEQAKNADLIVRGLPYSAREAIRLDGTERLGRINRLGALWQRKREHYGVLGSVTYASGQCIESVGSWLKKVAGSMTK